MNWISNFVRPKINAMFSRKGNSETLWVKCENCDSMIFHKEFSQNLNVCPNCNYHMYMSPKERFITLFDNGAYSTIDYESPAQDPLNFKDTKKYTDRIKDAQKSTGQKEAILVSEGRLGGMNTIIACQDFKFMGGSMGMAVGNAILEGVKRAVKNKSPFILFAAAGGARMQESVLSLIQMPRTTVAIEMLRDAALPYIVILTNPTTGGVTASYAMLGDIQIAEPNALICFAGPRVIEQTIREKLPEGFQRSEYLLDHGMLDKVVSRKFLREELIRLIYLLKNQPPPIRGNITEVDGSNGRDT
ncbi:acetyl-CoA carboxylase, carboxyltransferase subunit beta [Paracoccaceae bacterium]|nr:acetyl-CoA carboxylase, carboxyltransferase subunit beta [Paracoccaceae bacterium]